MHEMRQLPIKGIGAADGVDSFSEAALLRMAGSNPRHARRCFGRGEQIPVLVEKKLGTVPRNLAALDSLPPPGFEERCEAGKWSPGSK